MSTDTQPRRVHATLSEPDEVYVGGEIEFILSDNIRFRIHSYHLLSSRGVSFIDDLLIPFHLTMFQTSLSER